jgi:hypothetical protein
MPSVRIRFGVVLLPVALLWGCSTGHRAGPDPGWVRIEVNNDLVPASPIVVHLVGDGRRRLLGDVPPAQQRELQVKQTDFHGRYTLEARTRSSTAVTSPPFVLRKGDRLIWVLRSNLVTALQREGSPGESAR